MDLSNFDPYGYCASNPFDTAGFWTIALGTLFFLLSRIDYSWVDRVWSILPIVYQAHFIYHQYECRHQSLSARQVIMFILTCVWGARLSYNFALKGGYFPWEQDSEDYRWKYIRKNYPRILVILLNITFISYLQMFIILAFSSPIYYAKETTFGFIDVVLILLWCLLFYGEVLADYQQRIFQQEKKKHLTTYGLLQKCPLPYSNGFISDGLFSVSRHPNYFCQISMWWVMYLFSVASIGWNYQAGVGALALNLLFFGSINLTQKITKEKYGRTYTRYQQNTSMLIPMFGKTNPKTI